jgi:hypothetical protein
MNTATPLLTDLQSRILAFICERTRAGDEVGEDEIFRHFWPAPKFPAVETVESVEQWRAENAAFNAKAHGIGSGIPYGETYSAQRSAACIALGKLGLIREHNNGFNCYSYSVNKSAAAWFAAFTRSRP